MPDHPRPTDRNGTYEITGDAPPVDPVAELDAVTVLNRRLERLEAEFGAKELTLDAGGMSATDADGDEVWAYAHDDKTRAAYEVLHRMRGDTFTISVRADD